MERRECVKVDVEEDVGVCCMIGEKEENGV